MFFDVGQEYVQRIVYTPINFRGDNADHYK